MRNLPAIISAFVVISVTLSCQSLEPVPPVDVESSAVADESPGVTEAPIAGEAGRGGQIPASGADDTAGDETEETRPDSHLPPKAPPLSRMTLLSAVDEMLPWNMIQVHDDGVPFTVVHDLDKNGYDDALVLAVEGDSKTDASSANLSKSSRLFSTQKEYFNYFLLIFYQYSGDLILRYTVPVSRQLVFNGMTPFEIKEGSDFPYSLMLSFRTRSGIEKELVILSGYGITSFSLRENLSEFSHIYDIDDDGYSDIIIHEQGFEEGTGFETFLTWYKWNSREYTEYKNTNIVRNLRKFFVDCSILLKEGRFEAFFDYALDSEALRELKKQGLTDTEILKMVFGSADGSPAYDDFFEQMSFTSIVFPEIMETPFSYDTRNEFRYTVSVRFSRHGGDSQICLGELRMKQNPFEDKQFCFCPGIE